MARYGLDYYSNKDFPLSYYGNDNPLNYDASPVTAFPSGYSQITLTWNSPVGPWVNMRIIRSPYGYPVNITDGDTVYQTTRKADPGIYVDTTAQDKSRFYFYSIFIFDSVQLDWVLCGRASGLSIYNYATGEKLYKQLPQIYKLTTPYIASEATDNNDLLNFLKVFGYELDHSRALTELITNRYDFETITAETIPLLLNQFGLRYEPEIGYQNSRKLVRDSVQLTKEKGSRQGLREYIKGFTGWGCPSPVEGTPNPVVEGMLVGPNLMLDYNDSSFEEGVGSWIADSVTSISTCNQETIVSYFINNQYVRLNLDSTHGYRIGDRFTMSGWESLARFNTGIYQVAGIGDTYIEALVTGAPNIAVTSSYNNTTFSYPKVSPYPAPYFEPTSLTLYPNRQTGILSIANKTAISQAISVSCGSDAPITKGIPITAGDYYTFSAYSAASDTARSFTVGISWYDRFGVFMKTTTGTPVTNGTGIFTARAYVTDRAPTNITFNPFVNTAGSGYADGAYTNVPLTYVSGKQFTTAPRANITISGGAVVAVAVVNGGKGSDTTTIFTLNKNDIGSPNGSGFLATVKLVQESYYAAPVITVSGVGAISSNERHYFDACQFEDGQAVTAFDDARQIHITMKANRINELKNPAYYSTSNFAPWSFSNATKAASTDYASSTADTYAVTGYQKTGTTAEISTSTVHPFQAGNRVVVEGLPSPYSGSFIVSSATDFTFSYTVVPSGTVTFTAATGKATFAGDTCLVTKTGSGDTEVSASTTSSDYMPIYYPSTTYTFSTYVRQAVGNGTVVKARIYWYNSSKVLISSVEGSNTSLTTTAWARPSVSGIAPANAAYANVTLLFPGVASDAIVVDNAIFENSAFVLPYFDGSNSFGASTEVIWEGQTPNAARSHYYKNRLAITSRLVQGALDEWMVKGSTYALYLAQPKT